MDALWGALEGSGIAQWANRSRWGYAALNAAHILSIALLVGAVVPLGLRRLGLGRAVDLAAATRLLTPYAGAELGLSVLTGLALFAGRAGEYAAAPVFQAKMALVAFGALTAVALHASCGPMVRRLTRWRLALHAALSLATWLAVLVLGRLIAFA